MKTDNPEKMQDGTEAWLTGSGRYYCRREPTSEEWTSIAIISAPYAQGRI